MRKLITIFFITTLLFSACSGGNSEKEKFTVTFDTNGGEPEEIDSITIVKGQSMGTNYPTPEKDGFDFGGWYEGTTRYTSSTPINKDLDLKAKWNEKLPTMEMRQAANPLLKADFPDPSIIRVGDAYYMVSTTMYFCPIAPIAKSYDLINWKIVSYVADTISDHPRFILQEEDNGRIGAYGRGQWAASLRYFKDRFWVMFSSLTTNRTYLYHTANADTGPWEKIEYNRYFHDPSLFYDEEEDRMWVIEGSSDQQLIEMQTDLSGVKPGGVEKKILNGVGEGAHVYKLNGYYYIFIIAWRPSQRAVWCYRSADIEGPYEEKLVLNKNIPNGGGVAQGGIIQTQEGEWYGFFFQDRDAVGRVPVLVPMYWDADDWPVFGDANGNIPTQFMIKQADNYHQNYYVSDEFNSNTLALAWQWNHNPDNANWSLTERQGYLRLTTGRTSRTIYHARNTLTQRTIEPECEAVVALEPTSMKDGDIAGLVVLQAVSGFVGIEQEDGQKYVVMYTGDNNTNTGQNATVTQRAQVPFSGDRIYLKAKCRFRSSGSSDSASFAYSLDGETWTDIGTTVSLRFSLEHFVGVRFGLFNYATQEAGGYVDFDYYHASMQH